MAAVRGLRELSQWVWVIGNTDLINCGELQRLGIPEDWPALRPCNQNSDMAGWFNLDLKDFLLWWAENVDKDEAAAELLRMEKTG